MIRPIAAGLSPNVTWYDTRVAIRMLLSPWKWRKGQSVTSLERWFCQFFKTNYAVAFTSARGGIYAVLKGISIKKGDEVLVQAFTCSAVIQPILSLGAKPVYIDCLDNFSMDPSMVKDRITAKTKAIILQHTFGIPGSIEDIQKIAKEKNIFLIEDVAHSIGGTYKGKKLGTFAEAAVFSFGRDKAFSCVSGGMVITKNNSLGKFLRKFQRDHAEVSLLWIIRNILHPIFFSLFILPFYNVFSLGKIALVIFQKLRILSFPVNPSALHISRDDIKKLPNAMAQMELSQLSQIKKFNNRRKKISAIYHKTLTQLSIFHNYDPQTFYLRFPLLIDERNNLQKVFLQKHIYIQRSWYHNVIDPEGVSLERWFYLSGSCPNAEMYAKRIINLPTYPTLSDRDISKIQKVLTNYVTDSGNKK